MKRLSYKDKIKLLVGKNNWQTEDLDSSLPSLLFSDGPVGLRHPKNLAIWGGEIHEAVSYPSIQLLANTFDRRLSYLMGKAAANDCIEHNVDVLLAPGVNIKRIPQCGRNFEYFSEDPYLSGNMAKEFIRGLQSQHVGACIKHYACNSTEINRKFVSSNIDEKTLRDIYLKSFEIALKAKPWTLMTSYNSVNGVQANANKQLYDILRNDFGYKGLVMSDWEAVKKALPCIKAGLNLIMPYDSKFIDELIEAYKNGELSKKEINASIKPLLRLQRKIEGERSKRKITLTKRKRLNISRKIASEGIVLLKNENVLPLKGEVSVLGKPAFEDYHGGGSSEVNSNVPFVKLPKCLTKNGVKIGEGSNTVIYTCGDKEREELNRERITLPLEEEEEIISLSKTGKKIIVIIYAGSTIDMSRWIDKVDAILYAGYAGAYKNQVVADILTGKVNPSGKLSETFAKTISDYPGNNTGDDFDNTNYLEKDQVGYRYFYNHKDKQQFAFGFGLSYSTFELKNIAKEDNVVSLDLFNTSSVDGKEVIQLYKIGDTGKLELVDFKKVSLKKESSKRVEFVLKEDIDATYFIGNSSDNLRKI
ncbi:MAG: glycoside hydrolase family 3 C-terminal domain-containing protein [Bacilli bacterium]|nr:glycoside hydrolase family 3 C-terminal domain-containing protein [Bacilli bacterium]